MNIPLVVRLASWNIGAGILGESHQEGGIPDLSYHVGLVKEQQPDILCIQEAHDFGGGQEGQVESLAREAGYPFVISVPISPSHMDPSAQLTLGVLSRAPISTHSYTQFPNPDLSATGPTGNKWVLFDKGYMTCRVDFDGHALNVLNAHCFPLHYFDANPTEPRFAQMWTMFCADLKSLRQTGPTLAAIDLNHEPIESLLSAVLGDGGYQNSFTAPTIPKGSQQDYVIYDSDTTLLSTTVKPTQSDHSYCQVDVSLSTN